MKASDWIKVEDRLPEPNTRCIIRTIHDDYIPGVYLDTDDPNKCWFWGFNYTFYSNITHWLPIVPPKED